MNEIDVIAPGVRDDFAAQKNDFLQKHGLMGLPLSSIPPADTPRLLMAARIVSMNELDLYIHSPLDPRLPPIPVGWESPDFSRPLNTRNEGSALGYLVQKITRLFPDSSHPSRDSLLRALGPALEAFGSAAPSPPASGAPPTPLPPTPTPAGVVSHIAPAHFPDTGRGGMAMTSLNPGDVALSVPVDSILGLRYVSSLRHTSHLSSTR